MRSGIASRLVLIVGASIGAIGCFKGPVDISFDDFIAKVNASEIEEVSIACGYITGVSRNTANTFRTRRPVAIDGLANRLAERNVTVKVNMPDCVSNEGR